MDALHSPHDIEVAAKAMGISMAEVCRRAKIAETTFYRWRGGETEPSLGVYRRLCAAVFPDQDAAESPILTPRNPNG